MIRLPTERLLGEAATLLAPCLVNNLNFVDLFQEARARSQALPHMFAADLGDALGFGHVYAATREMEKSAGDELVGAIGLPPDAFPRSVLIINAPVTQPDAGTHKLLLMSE